MYNSEMEQIRHYAEQLAALRKGRVLSVQLLEPGSVRKLMHMVGPGYLVDYRAETATHDFRIDPNHPQTIWPRNSEPTALNTTQRPASYYGETAADRYHCDQSFREIVDQFIGFMNRSGIAAEDLRDAAMAASFKYRSPKGRPTLMMEVARLVKMFPELKERGE